MEILFAVQPMVWIENQLVGAYEGQTLVLECHSEAYPTAITYWTRPSNETITNGMQILNFSSEKTCFYFFFLFIQITNKKLNF